jgi:hypothetical protein
MSENSGLRTYTANGALGSNVRVKLTANSATVPVQVEIAGLAAQHVGITEFAVASGDPVTVRLRTYPGTQEVVAADSFAVGAVLYGAANGKVTDNSAQAGSAIGLAMEAAGHDGDVVEMVPFNVLSTTAATVSVEDTDTLTDTETVEAALAEIYKGLLTAQATIPVPLGAITLEDGTALTKQADAATGFAQLANKETVIMVPVNGAGLALGFTVPVSQDLNNAAAVTVHVLAGKDADNDTLTLDCEVYPCKAGDVANADIQDTAAQTIVAAVTELVFTCGAGKVLAAPGTLSVVLTAAGGNDGDKIYIYGAWVEYTRKILAA